MMHPQLRTRTSPSIWKVAGNIFKSAAAVICCSGIAELIAQLIGPKCLVTCLVSMALGWASQLVASGARTVGNSSVPAKTSIAVAAVMDNPALMRAGAESPYHR